MDDRTAAGRGAPASPAGRPSPPVPAGQASPAPRPPLPPRKVLVANRGEIAVRVIRACRELGLPAVAVYSDADRAAPHVRMADEAFRIGPAAPAESYLRADRILDAARRCGAAAIHPGYGFLSENAAFARAVEEAGLVFVGPPSEAIRLMGDKIEARRAMDRAGVPVVPGTLDPVAEADLTRAARDVGFPLMLKAVGGGGGKGIRIVRGEDELATALRLARAEAARAFGNDLVYLERLVERPRHIEIQILADAAGRVIHLGERECSVQRRHQKVLEECPAPGIDPALRARMGDAAVRAARSIGYRNAGTVEFLLAPTGEFYFLEMNTRLQVEHPVTEWVTGVDLVHEQLRIAFGQSLAMRQEDLHPRGAAIEVRVCAEDPAAGFLPSTGRIRGIDAPGGPCVRLDTGIETGMDVTVHYDPMLAKLIAWGLTREDARRRLARALGELRIHGLTTNVAFLCRLVARDEIREGRYDTSLLDGHDERSLQPDGATLRAAAAAAALLGERTRVAAAMRDGRAAAGGPPAAPAGSPDSGAAAAAGAAGPAPTPSPNGAPAPSAWQRAGRRAAMRARQAVQRRDPGT